MLHGQAEIERLKSNVGVLQIQQRETNWAIGKHESKDGCAKQQ